MKKLLSLFVLVSVLVSCSAKKQIETAITHGNYDTAIQNALRKLENNKHKKRKQDFVFMLKDAYNKAMTEDLAQLQRLKAEDNPELYKTIFETYLDLDRRQNAVKRVLPLKINDENIIFTFHDFSSYIISYKEKTSEYLLKESKALLTTNLKTEARRAHRTLSYVDNINPNYKDVRTLLNESHQKGINNVLVSVSNETNQIMPRALESELLNLNTYGLDNFWTKFHSVSEDDITYDYAVDLKLLQFNVSPERINERQLLRERAIVDGWEYVLDERGNVAKDSLGNDIKVDRIITTRARFYEVLQTKSAQIIADVVYTDLSQNEVMDVIPIDSGFIFENVFGRFRGDERALLPDDIALLRQQQIPFPSDSHMIIDTGTDLKQQLKAIISDYRLSS